MEDLEVIKLTQAPFKEFVGIYIYILIVYVIVEIELGLEGYKLYFPRVYCWFTRIVDQINYLFFYM